MQSVAHRRLHAFAMLEVLVACLVIVSGVLGISVLFARALGQARSALYRTAAVYLTDDLSESIRANASAAGAYTLVAGSAGAQSCAGLGASAQGCSPEALAASDLAAWSEQVKRALSASGTPSVEGTFASGTGSTNHFRIQVLWYEPGSSEPLTAASDLIIAPPVGPP